MGEQILNYTAGKVSDCGVDWSNDKQNGWTHHQEFWIPEHDENLGARIHKVEKGRVIIEAPLLPSTLQQQGNGHAGLTFSIGDSAAGYSALTLLPEDQEVMTAEIKINLLTPSDGELLRAEGKVVKPGKRLVVVTSEILALKERQTKLIAIMQGTMVPVPVNP